MLSEALSPAQYEQLLDRLAELSAQRLETQLTFGLFLFSLVLWSVLLPLSDTTTFASAVDGMYWAFITFSTVGLGDITVNMAGQHSLHHWFGFWVFAFLSIELGLLAAVINSGVSTVVETKRIAPSLEGMRALSAKLRRHSREKHVVVEVATTRDAPAPASVDKM